jgi:hypothetical protein
MENPSRFELESAVNNWRASLEGSPVLRDGDLRELEAHLRDAIESQRSQGRAVEDAFKIATQRLGNVQELKHEYAKTRSKEVWLDRALWVLVGNLFFLWISLFGNVAGETVSTFLLAQGASPWKVGSCLLAIPLLFQIGIVLACWRWLTGPASPGNRWLQRCLRWPLLCIIALAALYVCHPFLMAYVIKFALTVACALLNFSPGQAMANFGNLYDSPIAPWRTARFFLQSALQWFALYYLLRNCLRLAVDSQPAGASSPASANESSQSAAPLAPRCPTVLECRRDLWCERGAWMMASAPIKIFLLAPLTRGIEYLCSSLFSHRILPLDLYVWLTLALQAWVLFFVGRYLWRKANSDDPLWLRAGRTLLRWPAASTLTLFALTLASQALFAWGFNSLPIAFPARHPTSTQLLVGLYGGQIIHVGIPIVLIVWLACRRFRLPFGWPGKRPH